MKDIYSFTVLKREGGRRRRKRNEEKRKQRLACETRCAETMVAVYLVLTCGIVAARLRETLIYVQVTVVTSISRTTETKVASCKQYTT
jgi:hypothetical protein